MIFINIIDTWILGEVIIIIVIIESKILSIVII